MVQALVQDYSVDVDQQTDVTPLLMATQNRKVETGRIPYNEVSLFS